jgi:hypothetical protein
VYFRLERRVRAGLLAVLSVAIVSACGSEPGSIEIRNDLGRTVEVLQCDNNLCIGEFHITGRLEPDNSFPANVSTSGVPSPWLVRELNGKRLGCLPLVMPEPTKGLVARVSQVVPCKESYDESEFWPPRTRTPHRRFSIAARSLEYRHFEGSSGDRDAPMSPRTRAYSHERGAT